MYWQYHFNWWFFIFKTLIFIAKGNRIWQVLHTGVLSHWSILFVKYIYWILNITEFWIYWIFFLFLNAAFKITLLFSLPRRGCLLLSMDSYSHFSHVSHILGLNIVFSTSFDSEAVLWKMLGKPLPRINGCAARKGNRMAHHV